MNWSLMFQPLRKYADFNGRAQRAEYWLFTLFYWVVYVPLAVLGRGQGLNPFALLGALFSLGMLLPVLAVAVRRMHDVDKSGWWVLIGVIPIIGFIIWIVFAVREGTHGDNRFGADPKRPLGNLAEAF